MDFVAGINSGINDCGDTSNVGFNQIDWRLPNVRELQSLVDYGVIPSAANNFLVLPSSHLFSNFQAHVYGSSTTFADVTDIAWSVFFVSGVVSNNFKTNSLFVIAVRGGS